jgi:hypothetical protein
MLFYNKESRGVSHGFQLVFGILLIEAMFDENVDSKSSTRIKNTLSKEPQNGVGDMTDRLYTEPCN